MIDRNQILRNREFREALRLAGEAPGERRWGAEAFFPQPVPAAAEVPPVPPVLYEVRVVNGNYRAIDPVTGRSFMCRNCGGHFAKTAFGFCDGCSLCQNCGRYPFANPLTRRCKYCVCHFCKDDASVSLVNVNIWADDKSPYRPDLGQTTHDMYGNRRPTTAVRACPKCYKTKYLDGRVVCRHCGVGIPTFRRRGDKKPSLCANCAGSLGPDRKNVHYCCFCNNRAVAVLGAYIVCKECKNLKSCLRGTCTPRQPCKACKALQESTTLLREQERVAEHQQRAQVLNVARDYGLRSLEHYMKPDGVTCFGYPDCQGCVRLFEYIWMDPHRGDPKFVKADDPRQRKTNRSRRYIGVELEVCGLRSYKIVPKLRALIGSMGGAIVRDGSLPAGGFEINMPPLAGDHFIEQVKTVCEMLAKGGAWVNDTFEPETRQAGFHVHIDASDHTYADMKKLLFLYSVIEPALIRTQPYTRIMVGQDNGHGRRKRYCIPCGDRYKNGIVSLSQPKDKFKSALKSKMLENIYDVPGAPPRKERHPQRAQDVHYYALNVHSWFFRGTLECRLHTGTVDPGVITAWGMLWANIVDSAYRTNEKDIRVLMESTKKPADSLRVLLSLAPSDDIRAYINSRYKKYAAEYGDK